MTIASELAWRGLIHQCSDEQALISHLAAGSRGLYCGFDPTAESLHVGNLVPLLSLARFAQAGHAPAMLLGGATGLIGDPSGRDKERVLSTKADIEARCDRIRAQAEAFFARQGVEGQVRFLNNIDWTENVSAIEFLRDIGKHFTVNYMLAKDSVSARIGREEVGISFTEFSYMLLQAFDFYHLRKEHDISIQIGGSDQFGNITAGLELIRRKLGNTDKGHAFALTFPLITTASGAKFGKSVGGAIWLDAEKTSPYAMYQYFFNADDRDVLKFLGYFTYLDQAGIAELAQSTIDAPHLRAAQKRLAFEVVSVVHGREEAQKVVTASEALFGARPLAEADAATLCAAVEGSPTIQAAPSDAPTLIVALTALGLCKSNSEARRDIAAGAVTVNGTKADADRSLSSEDYLGGKLVILRRGKKNMGVVLA